MSNAEVLGYFDNGAGLNGIVMGTSSNFKNIKIVLYLKGEKSNTVLLENAQWMLNGDTISAIGKTREEIPVGYMAIATQGGIYYIPCLGGGYFVTPGYPAKIFLVNKKDELKAIALPITGGEIRGFKVGKNGIDLLIYNRETLTKVESGKRLYSHGRMPGENTKIYVLADKVGSFDKLKSNDPEIVWYENDKFVKFNSKAGKIEIQ